MLTPLDEAAVRAAVAALIAAGLRDRSSSTSCIPTPTRRTSAAPARSRATLWPNAYVTLGHALLSESREFERGITASVNAAVQPILDRYVEPAARRAARRAASRATSWS